MERRKERHTHLKAECQRTDAFKLWCWRRLLRVPWTARRSNQSILKEINSEYSLEGLMVKLKLQPRCLSPLQGNVFSLHCLDFQAEDRLTQRWHVGQPCGKASWESLLGKPRAKATDPLIHGKGSVTLLLQLGRKAHVHGPTRDED